MNRHTNIQGGCVTEDMHSYFAFDAGCKMLGALNTRVLLIRYQIPNTSNNLSCTFQNITKYIHILIKFILN